MGRVLRRGCVLLLLCAAAAGSGAQEDTERLIRIEPQPLASALQRFAEQSGLQLAYLAHVTDNLDSPGTDGAVTPEVALGQLLAGSNLEYEFVNADTAVIRERPAASPAGGFETEEADREAPPEPGEPAAGGTAGSERPRRARTPLDEVIVTGTRVERSGQVTPTPTTILRGETLRLGGDTRVTDFLQELPAIGATHTLANSNDDPAESGVGLLDLRRLGIERTLVLVNGRRHVGSRPGTSAIDVNTIPSSLIDRIEIITGGASAVYGADAVSGVVNIILRDDVDGLSLALQSGGSERGDGQTVSVSLTAGAPLEGDRGRVYVDITWDDTARIDAVDRDYASGALRFAPNAANTGPADGIADNLLLDNTRFNGTPPGGLPVIDADGRSLPGGPYTFDEDGALVRYDPGRVVAGAPALSVGGDGVFLAPFDRLQVPLERQILSGGFRYALNRRTAVFADGKFARTLSETAGQPTFSLTTFVPLFVTADNAYIRPDLAAVLAGDPDDPDDDVPGFFLPRTHVDLGRRRSASERDTTQILLGLRGELGRGWQYELSWQNGRTTNVTQLFNNQIDARLAQAVDAVRNAQGDVVCRDPSDGCRPANLLGRGLVSAAARDFVNADIVTRGQLEQQVASLSVNGRALELPAGPLGIAAGIEYRDESSATQEGQLRNEGRIFPGGPIEDVAGDFDVVEAFGEIVLPLVAGRPLVHASSLEAAVRVADYSTIGTTTTWRFGGDWMPTENLRLRGMAARAVRAPNIGELFAPARLQNVFLSDPCDQANLDAGSEFRRVNCAALGLPPDFRSTAGSITTRVFSGGNPRLTEEDARTLTLGVVYTPTPRFALTLDWWDIDIGDAVNAFPVQSVANNCVDLPTVDNPFCPSVLRGADGQFTSIDSSLINVAAQRARGIDAELSYELALGELSDRLAGSLNLSLVGTYLDTLEFQPLPDRSATDREAGELGDPRLAANLRLDYRRGGLTASWHQRLLGAQRFDRAEGKEVRRPDSTGTVSYSDLSLRYAWPERFTLFAGVANLFDRAPPAIARVPEARSFGDDVALYDVVGRYVYAGVRMALGD